MLSEISSSRFFPGNSSSVASSALMAIAAGFFFLTPVVVAEGPTRVAAPSQDLTWITLGTDAFASLKEEGVRFQKQALTAEAERYGVVATRVDADDLSRISEILHEKWRRCPGFLAHPHLDAALRSLAAADPQTAAKGGVTYEINQGPLVQDLMARLDKARILSTIEHLSTEYANRYYRHPSGVASAGWIRDQWRSLAQGRSDVSVEFFNHAAWAQPSVILTIEGSGQADQVVVLGGHQDSVAAGSSDPNFSAPGADDNASGIAVLTEVIRVAMDAGYVPERTVKFMAYAAEEVGLLGSQEIAAEFAAAGTDVVGVLQLDMTAFQGSVQDIAFLSDFTNNALTTFAKSLIDTYQPALEWTNTACGYGCSDHASWHQEGFPTIMPSEAIFGQHNQWIHTTSDIMSTFGSHADHSIKFANLGVALMVEVAGSGISSSIFGDGFESGNLSSWTSSIP